MGYLVLDVETASAQSAGYLCAVGCCVIEQGAITEEFYTLCNPGIVFDPFCVRIHGITEDMVLDAPDTEQVLTRLLPYLRAHTLVAHNAPFDAGQLRAAAARVYMRLPRFQTIDTVRLARKAFPGRPTYRLSAMAEMIGFSFTHHHALEDARACAALFLACRRALGETDQLQFPV